MSNPKGSNDDSSKKNECFFSTIGFQHNSGTSLNRHSDWIIDNDATNHKIMMDISLINYLLSVPLILLLMIMGYPIQLLALL